MPASHTRSRQRASRHFHLQKSPASFSSASSLTYKDSFRVEEFGNQHLRAHCSINRRLRRLGSLSRRTLFSPPSEFPASNCARCVRWSFGRVQEAPVGSLSSLSLSFTTRPLLSPLILPPPSTFPSLTMRSAVVLTLLAASSVLASPVNKRTVSTVTQTTTSAGETYVRFLHLQF